MELEELISGYSALTEDEKISFFSKLKTDRVLKDREAVIRDREKTKLYDRIEALKEEKKTLTEKVTELSTSLTGLESEKETLNTQLTQKNEQERNVMDEETKAAIAALESKYETELSTLKENLTSTQRKLMVSDIARDKGLPANALGLLQGNTLEELSTSADQIISLIGSVKDQYAPATPETAPETPTASAANPPAPEPEVPAAAPETTYDLNAVRKLDGVIAPNPQIPGQQTEQQYSAADLRRIQADPKLYAQHRDAIRAQQSAKMESVNGYLQSVKQTL